MTAKIIFVFIIQMLLTCMEPINKTKKHSPDSKGAKALIIIRCRQSVNIYPWLHLSPFARYLMNCSVNLHRDYKVCVADGLQAQNRKSHIRSLLETDCKHVTAVSAALFSERARGRHAPFHSYL